jgi:hypothetical protein
MRSACVLPEVETARCAAKKLARGAVDMLFDVNSSSHFCCCFDVTRIDPLAPTKKARAHINCITRVSFIPPRVCV